MPRPFLPALLALALASASIPIHAAHAEGAPSPASKGEPGSEAKAEAKARFDKALQLFEEGDLAGALAEFERAYALTGNLVVLYNIGLVHDAMGRYVEADRALSQVLAASPDPLKPEWRTRALAAQAHARARIGTIEITLGGVEQVDWAGAVVELDGVDVGRWPLSSPLRASIGKHVVSVLAKGFAPARKEVSVAGEASSKVTLEPVAVEGKLAQLAVQTNVAKATILVDGSVVGETPLSTSIALPPGKHVIEAKRAGYTSASTVLDLSAGGVGDAKLDLREDPAEVHRLGAVLVVRASEPAAIAVDGLARDAAGPLALPPGAHRLRVEASGFRALERDVFVVEGTTTTVDVDLVPTPQTLAAHDASVAAHRRWGFVGVGTGLAAGIVSGLFLGRYASKKSDVDARRDAHEATTFGDGECGRGVTVDQAELCAARASAIDADARANRTNLIVGLATGGVAVVGLGVGLWSFVTAPDADRFAKQKKRGETPQIFGAVTPGGFALGVGGRF